MTAIIQKLKSTGRHYLLAGSYTKESEAMAKQQELKADGESSFIETSEAQYAESKSRHRRFNVWMRLKY